MDGLSVLAGATAAAEAATTRVTQRIVVPGRRPHQTSAAPPSPTPPNIPHRTQVVRVPHGAAPGDRCEYRLPEGTVADRAEIKTAPRRRRAPRSSLGTRAHRSTTAPQVARHFVVPAGAQVGDLLEVSDGTARLTTPAAVGVFAGQQPGWYWRVRGDAASHWKPLDVANGARDSSRRPPPERTPPPPPPWSPAADPPWAQAPPPPPPPPQNDFAWPLGPWQG